MTKSSDAEKLKKYRNDEEFRKNYIEQQSRRQNKRFREMRKLRDQIFTEHQNRCDKCGFNDLRALVIHHLFGDNSKSYYQCLKEIIDHKVPISVLCANCHMILHNPKKIAQIP